MNPLLEWGIVVLLVVGSTLWVAWRTGAGIRAASTANGKACSSCSGCGGCPTTSAPRHRD